MAALTPEKPTVYNVKVFGRFVIALATIVIVLAVPVAQLRWFEIDRACCCPDPEKCHCPDHDPSESTDPAMRSCHTQQTFANAPLPAFEPVAPITVGSVERAAEDIIYPRPEPAAPPEPRRADAPS